MDINPKVLRAYFDHFLPRDVVGPVLVVFSLEGVIDGLFGLYVPDEYATLGWALVFILAIIGVAYWGTVDERALEDLQDRIDAIEDGGSAGPEGT